MTKTLKEAIKIGKQNTHRRRAASVKKQISDLDKEDRRHKRTLNKFIKLLKNRKPLFALVKKAVANGHGSFYLDSYNVQKLGSPQFEICEELSEALNYIPGIQAEYEGWKTVYGSPLQDDDREDPPCIVVRWFEEAESDDDF